MASCSYDDTIKIWQEDDYDWECRQTLEGHTSTVWSIAFNADGSRLCSCSDDRTIILWTLGDDEMYHKSCTLSGYHTRTIYAIAMDESERMVTGCGDDSLRIFEKDMESENLSYLPPVVKDKAHSLDVNGVAWNPKKAGLLASCGDDNLVRLWQFTPNQ